MPLAEEHSNADPTAQPVMLWDVFCQVIDNFGDIGVCWRLCADLAHRGHTIRLWVDDSSPLEWMAPGAREGQWPGVSILPWNRASNPDFVQQLPPADVWVEGFGCEIATEFIANYAFSTRAEGQKRTKIPTWINLEYLSAEDYVARCHALPSPVMQGPAKGWTKHFYYPGFTTNTGGLLREPALETHLRDWTNTDRNQWLAAHGVPWVGERLVSLFCYEPAALPDALATWMHAETPTLLLITPGRAARAMAAALPLARQKAGLDHTYGNLRLHYLEPMSQPDFDALLRCCDLNLVRGEDSLVRALWAGKPFVWHIYPQDDGAHADKLAAFLDCIGADTAVRQLHSAWNGLPEFAPGTNTPTPPNWAPVSLAEWQAQVHHWRARLQTQPDLVSALISFVQKRR